MNSPTPTLNAANLTTCDTEPIHIPGAILPHGAMLVVHADTFEVLQAAGDTSTLLGSSIDTLLGRSVEQLFSPPQLLLLRTLCADPGLIKPRHLLDPVMRVKAGSPLDASVHRSGGALVVEFEAADMVDPYASDPLSAVQHMVEGFATAGSLHKLCQMAAERVRTVAQYDRVMIYRFQPDGSGWVIAESRIDSLPPFLDLHYPAGDIPQQARALYLKNWLRLITQVNYEPAPLTPTLNPLTGKPLDMSQAILRDVSPVHREYLRNMGVDASMSISIIVGGVLWGLVACHHQSPRRLPRHLRAVCELFGSIFSLQLETRERSEQFEARVSSRSILQKLMLNLSNVDDYAVGLTQQSPNLLDYIHGGDAIRDGTRHGGVAIQVNGSVTFLGDTPDREQIAALTDWLKSNMSEGEGIFATDRLGELWAPAQAFALNASGLLAISVSRNPSDFILWFRPELAETTTWAGNPNKQANSGDKKDGLLSPRRSFESWKHTVSGRAVAWSPAELDAAFDLRVSLLQIVLGRIELAAIERKNAHERDKLLMAELDHRVKNTLANIQALVRRSSRNVGSLTDFVNGLDKRLHAMSNAHSLLTESRWEGVSIRSLLLDELEPYGEAGAIVGVNGPDVVLSSKTALAMSLAVHELATNAAKFGALSATGGSVTVDWALRDDESVGLTWREHGGPPVEPPSKKGFGSVLIERAFELETEGTAKLSYERAGVVCFIVLPRASIVGYLAAKPTIPDGGKLEAKSAVPAPPKRPRILFVEDSFLITIELEEMCEDLGWEMVGPASRIAKAIELASQATFDVALLDINLNGEMSWQVATILQRRGAPFAFSTGYDANYIVPSEFAGTKIVRKPYHTGAVEHCIRELIAVTA
jgi:two-component system, chemotaxis family, sensor kinase Cph1